MKCLFRSDAARHMTCPPFLCNVWKTAKTGRRIDVDDPWGFGRSLEWATSWPPPRHNFVTPPRIRAESPAFDLHHPTVTAPARAQNAHRRDAFEPGEGAASSLGENENG